MIRIIKRIYLILLFGLFIIPVGFTIKLVKGVRKKFFHSKQSSWVPVDRASRRRCTFFLAESFYHFLIFLSLLSYISIFISKISGRSGQCDPEEEINPFSYTMY